MKKNLPSWLDWSHLPHLPPHTLGLGCCQMPTFCLKLGKRSSMAEKGTAWLTALESALTEMATTPFTLRVSEDCGGTWGTGGTQLTKSACGQTDSSLGLPRALRCEVARCDSTQALTIHLSPHHGAYLTNRLFFPLTPQGSSPLF